MNHVDPEPDREEVAARHSGGFERMRTVAPMLDQLDAILDALGCKNGHHEFTPQFIGDPPGALNRRLDWSRTQVVCSDCGQEARLVYGEKPAAVPEPDVRKLLTADQIADALAGGFCGNTDLVQIRALPARMLWLALRRALDLINAADDPHAWLGSDEQHRQWTVRQHSAEGVLIDGPTSSRRQHEETIAAFESWHDPDGDDPRPDFRLELVYREVGPWQVAS